MKAFITKILKKNGQKGTVGKPEVQIVEGSKGGEKKRESQAQQEFQEEEDEQQIVNSLIRMSEHIKITKISRSLQGEHLTLCHINRMLCEQTIDVADIRLFLLRKSSERMPCEQEGVERMGEKGKGSAVQFYTHNSNGLIFQFYSVRALLWKICLKYLPASKNKWVSLMEGKLIHYQELIREYLLEIVIKKKKKREVQVQHMEHVEHGERQGEGRRKLADHPLNLLKDSKWKTFFEDRELWNLIQKDTKRTKPNCKFFQQQFQIQLIDAAMQKSGVARSQIHLSKDKQKHQTYYYDCLTRIIYIFLKRNQEYSYCQGMNQLAALVFYSFANKNSEYFRRVAESDAYFCFQKIMAALAKQVVPGFLNGEKYAHRFEQLLRKVDLRLFQELESQPGTLNTLRILSIRWFSGLFLNQFEIDDGLILWDGFVATLFREEGGEGLVSFHNLLMSVGLALIHLSRNALSQGENPMLVFAKIPYPPQTLLEKAMNLYKIFRQFFQ